MSNQVPSHSMTDPLEQPTGGQGWQRFSYPADRARPAWQAILRQIPDMLTLLRLILALVLFLSGLFDSQANLARDIWLLVIGWTTDMADGRIARSLKRTRQLVGLRLRWPANATFTRAHLRLPAALGAHYQLIQGRMADRQRQNTSWLGQHDVYVDMAVSLAVLGYLAVTALLPLWLPLAYLLVWGVLFLRWGIPTLAAQVFQNPIYAVFVFLAVRAAPGVLPWLLLWAALSLLFFWRRLLQLLQSVFSAFQNKVDK